MTNFSYFSLELIFLETSALTGENVEESFLKCSRTILNKIETGLCFHFYREGGGCDIFAIMHMGVKGVRG